MIPDIPLPPNFRSDLPSILLLFCLYVLQGIPLGLTTTVPLILTTKNVSYTDQAWFSLAYWPFSLKILVAPIVDAIYFKRLGRRKSWMVPMQYLIAAFMLILSFQIEAFLHTKNIPAMTAMFFILNFLAATQDVAVDGWALTMLKPENLGYASTCNAAGLTLGIVMGYSGFLALDSETLANKFRAEPGVGGLVSFSQFLIFWACIFFITTTLVLALKKEEPESSQVSEQHMRVLQSYKNILHILKLRNIQIFMAFLLTVGVSTAATGIARLKLIQQGIPKEQIAFMAIPLIPFQLLIPLLVSRWTAGPKPMQVYVNAVPFTLVHALVFSIVVWFTPGFKSEDGDFPVFYYVMLFGLFTLELLPGYTRFIAGMAFAAKVSDPAIGGTYMTFIATTSNIGGMWAATAGLALVDYVGITIRCVGSTGDVHGILGANKSTTKMINEMGLGYTEVNPNSTEPCSDLFIDGYYVLNLICVGFGLIWLVWARPTILNLQRRPLSTWRVVIDYQPVAPTEVSS